MKGVNKTQQIKDHLKEHGSITSWEAIVKYHATRLAAIICKLRREGWNIETETLPNKGSGTHAKYIYTP